MQPLYTVREGGAGNYPGLTFVLVSFGKQVGIGSTLSAALGDVLERTAGDNAPSTPTTPTTPGDGQSEDTQNLPVAALRLLQLADQKFAEADEALKDGDLTGYSEAVEEAQSLVRRAIAAD